jgi:hypothetical protein
MPSKHSSWSSPMLSECSSTIKSKSCLQPRHTRGNIHRVAWHQLPLVLLPGFHNQDDRMASLCQIWQLAQPLPQPAPALPQTLPKRGAVLNHQLVWSTIAACQVQGIVTQQAASLGSALGRTKSPIAECESPPPRYKAYKPSSYGGCMHLPKAQSGVLVRAPNGCDPGHTPWSGLACCLCSLCH